MKKLFYLDLKKVQPESYKPYFIPLTAPKGLILFLSLIHI